MSSDHPEDADGPPDRRDDHDGEGAQAARPGGTPAETRSHSGVLHRTAHSRLRRANHRHPASLREGAGCHRKVAGEVRRVPLDLAGVPAQMASRATAPQPTAPAIRAPRAATAAVSLDNAANARVELECDRIAARERDKISPALRAAESQDPDRHLIRLRAPPQRPRPHQREGRCDSIEESRSFSRGGRFACARHDPVHLSVPRSSLHPRRLVGHRPPERTRLRAAQAQEFLVR